MTVRMPKSAVNTRFRAVQSSCDRQLLWVSKVQSLKLRAEGFGFMSEAPSEFMGLGASERH